MKHDELYCNQSCSKNGRLTRRGRRIGRCFLYFVATLFPPILLTLFAS